MDAELEELYKEAMDGKQESQQSLLENSYSEIDDKIVDEWMDQAIDSKNQNLAFAISAWYDDVRNNGAKYIAGLERSAEIGYDLAHFFLGEEYRKGRVVDKDYAKALSHYDIIKNSDWYDILGEINPLIGDKSDSFNCIFNYFSNYPLNPSSYELDWWLFVLEKHPSATLKFNLAEWFWSPKEGTKWPVEGAQDRNRALSLYLESAKENCAPACLRLAFLYATNDDIKDREAAIMWMRKAEELGEDAGTLPLRLGVIPKKILALEEKADKGDLEASAELAKAYMMGVDCPKDYDKVYDYASNLLFEDEDFGVFLEIDRAARTDQKLLDVERRLHAYANEIESWNK